MMKMDSKQYGALVKNVSKKSPLGKDMLMAFLFGGGICCLAEVYKQLLMKYTALNEDQLKAAVPVTLIAITALLTAIGVFDKIAKHAGAGTIVPITGFANAVVSPAVEFKTEGLILGTGAKMFVIAGPVIVYGVAAGVIYGLVLLIFGAT